MTTIAKVLVYGPNSKILCLMRSKSHPRYALQPDLPGGEVENGESITSAIARELKEETGVSLTPDSFTQVYKQQATPNKIYVLFQVRVKELPNIRLSWEHSDYSWLSEKEMLSAKLPNDIDNYYSMVMKYLRSAKL